ncbi:MAG: DUF6077 domain-containing protein [Myxococcota bacterium]
MQTGPEEGTTAKLRAPSRPLSVTLCGVLYAAAALWTLCCHAVVAMGGGLWHLVVTSSLAATTAGLIAYRFRAELFTRPPSGGPSGLPDRKPRDHDRYDPDLDPVAWATRAAVVVLGIGSIWWASGSGDVVAIWAACVLTIVAALAWLLRFSPQPVAAQPAREGWGYEIALWAMAIGSALVVLVFHRPDMDTPFYVSMAVAASDAPSAPLMRDAIHGVDLPIHMPAHRLHSFEVFVGAVSWATGLPAIFCYQVVVATISALLTPIALARLFRILAPGHWPWAVAAALAVLVGAGGAMSWYGNLSLVRIFHGKSVYLSVMLPLVYAYGMRFGAEPTLGRWLRLCAVQIAALGLTSSALWSAPVAAGLAVCCTVHLDRRAFRTLAMAALSSTYLVAAGLSIVADLGSVTSALVPDDQVGASLAAAFERVLGGGPLQLAALIASVSTWALYRGGPAQRFAIIIPLFALGWLLNPYAVDWVQRFMTGPSFWRAMWGLPIPVLMALMLSAPMGWFRFRPIGALCSIAAIGSFVAFVPAYSTIGIRNSVTPGGFPQLSVPLLYFASAQRLAANATPGTMVVAPQKVALFVPSLHGHPYVTYSRAVYLRRIEIESGEAEGDLRMLMSDWVSGPGDIESRIRNSARFSRRDADPLGDQKFRDGLEHFSISAVCLNRDAPRADDVRATLQQAGFRMRETIEHYEIWSRDGLRKSSRNESGSNSNTLTGLKHRPTE